MESQNVRKRKRCSAFSDSVRSSHQKKNKNETTIDENEAVFTAEELEELDRIKMPYPPDISLLSRQLYDAYHRLSDCCVVCGEFCDDGQWFQPCQLPAAFFKVLTAPIEDKTNGVKRLPIDLIQQYDVCDLFLNDERFKQLLLNRKGIKKKEPEETEQHSGNVLCICSEHGCLPSLNRGNIPKFSTAQGNYFGQLPLHLRNMSQASLSLIRPVQSFGYLIAYKEDTTNDAAIKLSGHMYSTRLETAMIRKKLPLKPEDAEIRVLVTSPGCKKDNILARAKLAAFKKDYIVEKEKIREALEFFKKVKNATFSDVEIDAETL